MPPPPVSVGAELRGNPCPQRGEHGLRGTEVQRGRVELVAHGDRDRADHGFVADACSHRGVELVLIQLAGLS